ncbi:hypothetical protein KR054_000632 [Drosophila jambulina]|nr:hypothetical protein KR054_000632 [Drosophila jambulina]
MIEELHPEGPNVCGLLMTGSVGWHRHAITGEDTMARLALQYNTSIGLICRANRMHGRDILQTRRHIWVPLPTAPSQTFQVLGPVQVGREEQQALFSASSTSRQSPFPTPSPSPPRSSFDLQLESSPNPNCQAEKNDPLLII